MKARISVSAEQVDAGVGLVNETGQALARIVTRITEINHLVNDIAVSAENQSSGLQQVNIAVGQMDMVTQQNAAMVEQATAAVRSLAGRPTNSPGKWRASRSPITEDEPRRTSPAWTTTVVGAPPSDRTFLRRARDGRPADSCT
ncbi:hypothetical protein GCM10020258_31440 [Sphingomonas yabuuchiae]